MSELTEDRVRVIVREEIASSAIVTHSPGQSLYEFFESELAFFRADRDSRERSDRMTKQLDSLGIAFRTIESSNDVEQTVTGVAHSSSPVVADAGAATPDHPALTVQEGTGARSPGAGAAGACQCAAPAGSFH